MQRRAGGQEAAFLVVEAVGFGVEQMRLDVEQPIGAAIAVHVDLAAVHGFARGGVGQRHDGPGVRFGRTGIAAAAGRPASASA